MAHIFFTLLFSDKVLCKKRKKSIIILTVIIKCILRKKHRIFRNLAIKIFFFDNCVDKKNMYALYT